MEQTEKTNGPQESVSKLTETGGGRQSKFDNNEGEREVCKGQVENHMRNSGWDTIDICPVPKSLETFCKRHTAPMTVCGLQDLGCTELKSPKGRLVAAEGPNGA